MGKLRLSVHRKNERRRKYGFYPVRIPLSNALSVLTVSLPLDKLSYTLSLPLSAFTASPVESVTTLKTRITSAGILPQGCCNKSVCITCTVTSYCWCYNCRVDRCDTPYWVWWDHGDQQNSIALCCSWRGNFIQPQGQWWLYMDAIIAGEIHQSHCLYIPATVSKACSVSGWHWEYCQEVGCHQNMCWKWGSQILNTASEEWRKLQEPYRYSSISGVIIANYYHTIRHRSSSCFGPQIHDNSASEVWSATASWKIGAKVFCMWDLQKVSTCNGLPTEGSFHRIKFQIGPW